MKNIFASSFLTILMIASFSSCQKAKERPNKLHKSIAGKVVALNDLSDLTRSENQDSEANLVFKHSLIEKISDSNKRDHAYLLLSQNKITYLFTEGKVLLLEIIPANTNRHSDTESTLEASTKTTAPSDEKLHTVDSLVALKQENVELTEKFKSNSDDLNRFVVLAEIGMTTGILENDRTDYNEKKSVLKLTETNLSDAQYVVLKKEVTTDASDASAQ